MCYRFSSTIFMLGLWDSANPDCVSRIVEKCLNLLSCISDPLPVAVRSKAEVCGLSIAKIAGSNPAEGMDVDIFCSLCVVYVVVSARA
jgi:hypothetical protein